MQTTATDPAVAAATAAQSAAESAKTFAEQSSIDANTAATNALAASNNTFTEGQSAAQWAKLAYDKSVANSDAITNIQNSVAPAIAKIGGYGGATCTKSTSFDMVVQSSGATQIRTRVNRGPWSEWQTLIPLQKQGIPPRRGFN